MWKFIAVLFINTLFVIGQVSAAQPYPESADACTNPANPVVAENCKPGSDEWIVTNALGDIEGFAYPTSVSKGDTLNFYVNTSAAHFELSIFRSGFYGGSGGRLIEEIDGLPGKAQPACQNDLYDTGLVSCSNWSSSYSLTIPEDWTSGIYVAKLTRRDTGGQNYMLFVVRDDARDSEILYQQSLFTYHAYNGYGGKSLYNSNSGFCRTCTGNPRAAKVSLVRPYDAPVTPQTDNNIYFKVEYPMVRWLEQQGYDVTYSTNLDTHRSGLPNAHNELLDHRVFLSVGHDEYWTQEMDDAVTMARDAGVHIGVFSANTSYWRVRLEPDPWSNTPDSVVVSYKTTEAGNPDPTGHATGTFRDPLGVDDPENGLIGIMYIGDNNDVFFPLRVSSLQGKDPIYRHTDLQTMPAGTYIDIGKDIIGWEWDAVVENGHTPAGLQILAESPVHGFLLQDAGNAAKGTVGSAVAHTSRYVAPSGAIVFAAGTIQWSWGLGARGIEAIPPDPYIQQITYNLLADMGTQPATPSDSLILDGEPGMVSSPEANFLRPGMVASPTTSNITVNTDGSWISRGRTASISWETDIPTQSQLWLIEDPPKHFYGPIIAYRSNFTESHSISVSNLWPNMAYRYWVLVIDESGNAILSEPMRFETPPNLLVSVGSPVLAIVRNGLCWINANPILAAVGGVVLAAIVLLAGWRLSSSVLRIVRKVFGRKP